MAGNLIRFEGDKLKSAWGLRASGHLLEVAGGRKADGTKWADFIEVKKAESEQAVLTPVIIAPKKREVKQ